jgi:hypothetical protein
MQLILRSIWILSICLISYTQVNAQGSTTPADAEVIKSKKSLLKVNNTYQKPSKDYVMLQAGYHGWLLGNNTDSIKLRNRGHDVAVYLCNDFALAKKGFSFSAGVGISSANVYFDSTVVPLTDSYRFVTFLPDNVKDYKRYKLSSTYLEAPFEFRYFGNNDNRNRGFKMALGLKIGTLINAHTKGVGTYFGTTVRDKANGRRYHEQWRITTTARVGWGNFSIFTNYQLSNVFKSGNNQNITPFSVGLCISGM